MKDELQQYICYSYIKITVEANVGSEQQIRVGSLILSNFHIQIRQL